MPSDADYLLDELHSSDCPGCGRTPERCEEAGGCRWTRELADREQQLRRQITEEVARIIADAPTPQIALTRLGAWMAKPETARGGLDA